MKRRLIIILVIFFATVLSCQKKIFKRVTVTGRLLEISTQAPLGEKEIVLYGDDVTSAKSSQMGTIKLATRYTRKDGTFKISCNSSRRGRYYLRAGDQGNLVLIDASEVFYVPDNTRKNLGDIFVKN
jgi:hypothetical protein